LKQYDNRPSTSFRTEVGIGSAAKDLFGSRQKSLPTYPTVVFRNVESDDDDVIGVKAGRDITTIVKTLTNRTQAHYICP